jgi:hypothetical protein
MFVEDVEILTDSGEPGEVSIYTQIIYRDFLNYRA